VPRNGNIIIAGIMQAWIPFPVGGHLNGARAGPQSVQICRRIVVVVKIDDAHSVYS
jgi:hypothetical protein